MSLFDQKEDVLEIQMTPYGKHLYSKGLFKPAFYSFHDDEIIYDISYADNQTEIQTAPFERLTQDCVYLRPQGRFTTVEETLKKVEIINPLSEIENNNMPLGNSSLSSDFKPAWAINVLKGVIDSFEENFTNTNTSRTIDIPQINLKDITYLYETKRGSANEGDGYAAVFINNVELILEEDFIIFSVEEGNVDVLRENFNIEIFEVIKDSNGNEKELKQVFFKKEKNNIINNILVDDNQVPEEIVDENLILVDNYFEIQFDSDIDFGGEQAAVEITAPQELTKPPYGDNC